MPAFPFIDTDAQQVIKTILDKIANDGRTKPTDRILLYKQEIELTRALKRLVKRAGLNVGNKVVRFHNLRKFLCDHLSSHMAESRWKLIVGKKISEPAYISPESLREDYARAMAETTFSKNFGDLEKRIKEIEDLKQTLGPDVVKRLSDLGIQLRESSSKKKKPEPCKNGKCQHVIAENQLEEFLANGYYVVAVLQSGKVVVSNEA